MIIRITDPLEDRHTASQSFLENRYDVISRSGLSPTEAQLIQALPMLSSPEHVLVMGNRTGVLGMIASRVHPGSVVVTSTLDLFHHHAVERNLARNPFTTVTARCEADIAERNHYDAAFLQLSKGSMPDELILDLLQQSHLALKMNGTCLISAEENTAWLAEHVKKVFGQCSIRERLPAATLLAGHKKQDPKKIKDYRAEFTMTLPHGKSAALTTRPGVFAHRRVDEGAQALAEVVVTQPGDLILDMGCGCGSIGLSLAVNQPSAEVVFLDSHTRALHATEHNCRINGLSRYRVVLADQGLEEESRFTLFVGNPPYYSNDRITDLFIHTAFKTLKPQGRAYLVAKHSERNAEVMKTLFGNAEILHRRGYQIARAVKS